MRSEGIGDFLCINNRRQWLRSLISLFLRLSGNATLTRNAISEASGAA